MKKKLRTISLLATVLTMIIGTLVIIGWVTHNDFLMSIVPGGVKMKFNSALCFLLSSMVLLLHFFPVKNKLQHRIPIAFSVLVSLTGLLTLLEYIFNYNIGIDEFFVRDELSPSAIHYAGRMSPLSALNFLLIGIGLLLLNNKKTAIYQFHYLSSIAFVSLIMLISFNFISDIPTFIRLPIHVAVGFITLSAAIYFAQSMMQTKISFERTLYSGFIAAIVLLSVIGIFSSYYNDQRISTTQWVDHTNEVLSEAEQILSLTKDFDSGSRGYIILGDSNYLGYFTLAKDSIFSHIKRLKELTVDNAPQQVRIDSLTVLVDKRIDFSLQLIQLRNEKGFEAARSLLATGLGKFYTDQIRYAVSEIKQDEKRLLSQRENQNNVTIASFNRAYLAFLTSVFILLTFILFSIRNNIAIRKKAEAVLQNSNDRNKIFVEQAPNAIAMFDKNMCYMAASQRWVTDYELEGKQLVGSSHYAIFPEIGDDWKTIHQECLNGAINVCEEARFERLDGSEQWIAWDVRPWHISNGIIGGIIMYTADISRRKNAEKIIHEERMLLRTLVDNIPLNVYVKDLKSRKTLVNRKEMEYLSVKNSIELLGKDDFELYPTESAILSVEEDQQVFLSGEAIIDKETLNVKKDGSNAWFLTSKIPLKNANGEISGLVGLSYNITERKEAAEKLRRYSILESKSKEMEQFAYIASHDLREPLLTIINYIELLIEDFGENLDEEAKRYTTSISGAAHRMDQLIHGLLDYSRLSKIKQLQDADCNEIVKEVQADLNLLITSSGASIIVEELPLLKAYPLELKLLFQNLINNAIKFRRKGVSPEIHITSNKIKDGWQFEIRDNGIGIKEYDKRKIFIMFQQLHNKNEYPGTGIGLAHCKKIAELHNGSIWVESKSEHSSSFCFTIVTES